MPTNKCQKCYQPMQTTAHDFVTQSGEVETAYTDLCKRCDVDVITFFATQRNSKEIDEFWRKRKLKKKK